MAKQFKNTLAVRMINRFTELGIRLGLAPGRYVRLTVRGRKTGKSYSTPVALVRHGDRRWLVSPYGEVSWVKNARAAGEVTISRGGRTETVAIRELQPKESASILKEYLLLEPITRPYFGVSNDAPIEEFVAEAPKHPVFELGRLAEEKSANEMAER